MARIGKLSELRKSAKTTHPYTLDLGNGEKVTINRPGLRSLFQMSKHQDDPEKVLELLTGDAFEQVYDAIADDDVEVFNALVKDLTEAFGMSNGEEENPTKP